VCSRLSLLKAGLVNFLPVLASTMILVSEFHGTHDHYSKHSVSMTTNRWMLFREIIAVYCENHTEHVHTLCGQNAVYINSVRISQDTHYVCATKPNRWMLFREIIAVYCENHTEHINTLCVQNAHI
jgi:hypothetical protein